MAYFLLVVQVLLLAVMFWREQDHEDGLVKTVASRPFPYGVHKDSLLFLELSDNGWVFTLRQYHFFNHSPPQSPLLVSTNDRDLWREPISWSCAEYSGCILGQSDLSDLTLILWIADFRCWSQPEGLIFVADQKDRGLRGRLWTDFQYGACCNTCYVKMSFLWRAIVSIHFCLLGQNCLVKKGKLRKNDVAIFRGILMQKHHCI